MGGTSEQKQTQTSNATSSGKAQSQLSAYDPANPAINNTLSALGSINPTNSTGLQNLYSLGAAGNPYAGQIGNVANTLLSGGGPDRTGIINDAYSQYQQTLQPYASGEYNDPSTNPALQKYLQVARDDASNSINSQFAGAGRDLSGYNQQAVSRGIGQAEAPILYDAYNQGVNRQLGAASNLFGAGGTTAGSLSALDQTRLGNQVTGIGAADAANQATQYGPLLQIQAQTGIPLQQLAQIMGIALPAATALGQQNQTQSGTQQGTQTGTATNQMSGAQQFATIAGGLGSLFSGGSSKPKV